MSIIALVAASDQASLKRSLRNRMAVANDGQELQAMEQPLAMEVCA